MTYPEDLIQLANLYPPSASTSNLARWKSPIYLKLVEYTSFLPTNASTRQRFYHVLNGTHESPICKNGCLIAMKWHASFMPGRYTEYCIKCAANNPETLKKRQATCLVKYGAVSFSSTKQHKELMSNVNPAVWQKANEKRNNAVLNRYGVQNVNLIPGASAKRKTTNLAKYGHTNILASNKVKQIKIDKYGTYGYTGTKEFAEKSKATMMSKYGVQYSGQSSELLAKSHNTNLLKYGTSSWSKSHISPESLSNLNNPSWLYQQHIVSQIPSTKLAEMLGVDKETVGKYLNLAGIERTRHPCSYPEKQLSQFLTELGIVHTSNDRKLLRGKELDVIVESHKIAIEYCGLYWHSSAHSRNHPDSHYEKVEKCAQLGYQLLTIFEDEWIHKSQLVKHTLACKLGIITSKQLDQSFKISHISDEDSNQFFLSNRILPTEIGNVNLGILYHSQIIAAMTLIERDKRSYTITGYISVDNYSAFLPLLMFFKSEYFWDQLTIQSDLRWHEYDGQLDQFHVVEKVKPQLQYVDIRNTARINVPTKYTIHDCGSIQYNLNNLQ